MATFLTPDHALAAALKMREAMRRLNETHGREDLLLKIVIHEGPCLAVNLNERQDYFGQTVNIASRRGLPCRSRSWRRRRSCKIRAAPACSAAMATNRWRKAARSAASARKWRSTRSPRPQRLQSRDVEQRFVADPGLRELCSGARFRIASGRSDMFQCTTTELTARGRWFTLSRSFRSAINSQRSRS